MKTYEERSPRYKRNAERVEQGLGLLVLIAVGLCGLGLLAGGIAATLGRLF